MLLRLTLVAGLFLLGACAGDEAKTEEPVASTETPVPDAPGGETAQKPAGEGKAGNLAKPAKGKGKKAATAAVREGEGGNGPMVVTSGALNVRSTNSMKTSTVVRTLQKGEKVDAKNCDKWWCEIGANEWVSKAHLAPQ